MQEYIVTLKSYDDLDGFYEDMETKGGPNTIPSRKVNCSSRRPISRNTHYILSEEEAENLKKDHRVLDVELIPSLRGIEPVFFWEQTGDYEKSSSISSTDKNWGLYRSVNGHVVNWGNTFTQQTGTVTTTSSGKHVDVVIVDAHINPNHPEFAVNPDGTGGSRVNQYDWFQHSASLGIPTVGQYSYASISSNHGTHVAGIAAGNTQGWARDANIYNIEFDYSGSFPYIDWTIYLFDYIREWHKTKPINPITKRRNPTIVNNSWGYSYSDVQLSAITSVTYRGEITDLTALTVNQKKNILETKGIPVPTSTYLYRIPARVSSVDVDIADAINDGVILVASAGNSYWEISDPDSQDWNNYVSGVYHQRGSTPGAANEVICVGSVGTSSSQYKSSFSNYGKRVDIWASGSNVTSSVYDSTAASEFGITLANDPRNSNYKIGSISGTSMASPQVTGIIACYAEQNPSLTPTEAINYLIDTCENEQVGNTGGGYGDYLSLGQFSNNRYLKYKLERQLSGKVFSSGVYRTRDSAGVTFPRIRLR